MMDSDQARVKRLADPTFMKNRNYSSFTVTQNSSPSSSTSSTPRKATLPDNPAATAYGSGQSLASVLNNPKLGKAGVYGGDASWAWIIQGSQEQTPEGPPPLPAEVVDFPKSDFAPYLSSIGEVYAKFVDVRNHDVRERERRAEDGEEEEEEDDAHENGEKVGVDEVGKDLSKKTILLNATRPSLAETGAELKEKTRAVPHGPGQGLAACLREVPPIYFDDAFALEKRETFDAACPFASVPANMLLQEKLSHYLDLVEVYLVKEISSRSESFFEALEKLEDLNERMADTCGQIRMLRGSVGELEADLIESAERIQNAGVRKGNLLALHQKLKVVDYVNQALITLKLLVSSSDAAGSLDVIDDLQGIMASDELMGLHCFRNVGQQLQQSADAINSTLQSDFLRDALLDSADISSAAIRAAFEAQKRTNSADSLQAILAMEGSSESDRLFELKDQLLPTIICLLRTSRLPAVLRSYRDALNSDIKTAIKNVVGELLPLLFEGQMEPKAAAEASGNGQQQQSGGAAGLGLVVGGTGGAAAAAASIAADADGGLSLALKLRGLNPAAFLRLLLAVFSVVQVRLVRAAEVRSVILSIVTEGGGGGGVIRVGGHEIEGSEPTRGVLEGDPYAAAAVAAAFALGAERAAEKDAQERKENQSKVSGISSASGNGLSSSGEGLLLGAGEVGGDGSGENSSTAAAAAAAAAARLLAAANTSRQLREDILRVNTESVSDACDVAHGRWSKLLGVRAPQTPKLSLADFIALHDVTNNFISATERLGGRQGFSIRGTLQSQAKSFVDAQHSAMMAALVTCLDKEQWAAIDAPSESQAIVDEMERIAMASVEAYSKEHEEKNGAAETRSAAGQETEEAAEPCSTTSETKAADLARSLPVSQGELSIPNEGERERGASGQEPGMGGSTNSGSGRSVDKNDGVAGLNLNGVPEEESRREGRGGGMGQQGAGEQASAGGREEREGEAGSRGADESRSREVTAEAGTEAEGGAGAEAAATGAAGGDGATAFKGTEAAAVRAADSVTAAAVGGAGAAGGAARRKRVAVKTIRCQGEEYHIVACVADVLRMVRDYLQIAATLPSLSADVIQRLSELLKVFNSRTCQLVLGAGAMQVSGLKSITTKQLALSAQAIALVFALIPFLRMILSVNVHDSRKAIVLSQLDRIAQDFRVHRDEILSKLVAIMRERLAVHLKNLSAVADSWSKPDDSDSQPSPFAKALTKEVGVLHRVLSPILLDSDLRSIFVRVVALFHSQLAEAFSRIETPTPHSKRRMYRDIQLLLNCMRTLTDSDGKLKELDQFVLSRFGATPPP